MARLILIALIALAGCRVVDQRVVAGWLGEHAVPPDPALANVGIGGTRPYLTIRLTADLDPRPTIATAVEAAEAQRPGARYDVVAATPLATTEAVERQAGADARTIADAIRTAGVPEDRVRVGLTADPGEPGREVRVFLR